MSSTELRMEGPKFWAALLCIGVAIEALAVVGTRFWLGRYSADPLSIGPFLFVLCLCSIFIGAQVLHALFNIDTVAGMSLSLLAAMVGWFGVAGATAWLLFLIGLAIHSMVRVPTRLLSAAFKGLRRKRA